MKSTVMNKFQSMLPEASDFNINYLVGKQSTKYWLMCQKDFKYIWLKKKIFAN